MVYCGGCRDLAETVSPELRLRRVDANRVRTKDDRLLIKSFSVETIDGFEDVYI